MFADLYIFSRPDRTQDQENKSSEEIPDSTLKGKAEGHTAGSQQCHNGSHRAAHHIHRGENNDHREEDFDQVLQESPQGRLNGQQFLVAFKQFPDPVNQKKTDHKHQDAAEEVHTGFFQPTEDAVHIRADVRIHAAVLLLFCGFAVLVLQ